MKKNILFFVISLGAVMFASSAGAALALYNPLQDACNKVSSNGYQAPASCSDAANQTTNDNPVIRALTETTRVISLIVGFASIILIVVSGINMITSAGNSEAVASAKKKLTGAIIGLAVASLAWTIASFVINRVL